MKNIIIFLLATGSLGVFADEHKEFTIDCIDKIKNKCIKFGYLEIIRHTFNNCREDNIHQLKLSSFYHH